MFFWDTSWVESFQVNAVAQVLDPLGWTDTLPQCGLNIFPVLRKDEIGAAGCDPFHQNIKPPRKRSHVFMEVEAMKCVDDNGYTCHPRCRRSAGISPVFPTCLR